MTESEQLSPTQERALEALLRGESRAKAAAAAEVSEKTLWRWLRDEVFLARLRDAQRELFTCTMAGLQEAGQEALATLRAVMADKNAKDSARVSAAKAVLEYSRQQIEFADLEERLAALERANEKPNRAMIPKTKGQER